MSGQRKTGPTRASASKKPPGKGGNRARSAADGTSTMTPGFSPRARTASPNDAASATVATIGAITQVSVPVSRAASAIPSS